MKYKVKKGCKLFTELHAVKKKIDAANKAARKLSDELGFDSFRKRSFCLAGGISSFYKKDGKKPDGYAFAFKPSDRCDFFPRIIKANKELLAKISELPTISYEAITDLINYDDHKLMIGNRLIFVPEIIFTKEYILIGLEDGQEKYKPVTGMVEILASEYYKLAK